MSVGGSRTDGSGAPERLKQYWDKLGGRPTTGAARSRKRARRSVGSSTAASASPDSAARTRVSSDKLQSPSSTNGQPGKRRKSSKKEELKSRKSESRSSPTQSKTASRKKVNRVKSIKSDESMFLEQEIRSSPEQDVDLGNLVGIVDIADSDEGWKPPMPSPGSWDPLIQSVDNVFYGDNHQLFANIIWRQTNESNMHYRTKAALPTIYRACPQRVCGMLDLRLLTNRC